VAARVTRAGRAPVVALIGPLVAALVVAGCWGAGLQPVSAPTGVTPSPSVSAALETSRLQIEGALKAGGISLVPATDQYRPAESASLATAPRLVLVATLPDDPEQGRIVVYDLGDPQRAYEAAHEMAAYIATGPGRVQLPPDARVSLRLLGQTVILTVWSPSRAADPAAGERMLVILGGVGETVPIPAS
jgi:hypothetical protein